MVMEVFKGNFTQQEPLPQDAVDAAVDVLNTGRLHRYNLKEGDAGEVSLLELEFAKSIGADFCLAVASGGYALATALRAIDVKPAQKVLTNAFTLAPVPGAIASINAVPLLVEVTENLTIDLDDLEAKASQSEVLLLSHMRGHICDMEKLMEITNRHGIKVIEDCAHTMGAGWNDKPSGSYGVIGCFSTQTYKHINSGEGGFLTTNDPTIIAKSIALSGSYMMFDKHLSAPEKNMFEAIKYDTPNISGRMDHLRAAILRPQLKELDKKVIRWNERYRTVEAILKDVKGIFLIERSSKELFVGSSFQFLLKDFTYFEIQSILTSCRNRGVELKWFGMDEPHGFTSKYDSWKYIPAQEMAKSDRIINSTLDMRLPLTFSVEDCRIIATIIGQEVEAHTSS
jgi:dTDP-4-amino-4,6-dideoxygalactose transaminase